MCSSDMFPSHDRGEGNVVNMLGSVEDVVFENDVSWNELEKVLKEKFKEYKEGEIDSGYGGGCCEYVGEC